MRTYEMNDYKLSLLHLINHEIKRQNEMYANAKSKRNYANELASCERSATELGKVYEQLKKESNNHWLWGVMDVAYTHKNGTLKDDIGQSIHELISSYGCSNHDDATKFLSAIAFAITSPFEDVAQRDADLDKAVMEYASNKLKELAANVDQLHAFIEQLGQSIPATKERTHAAMEKAKAAFQK